jgi:hypothetical protein
VLSSTGISTKPKSELDLAGTYFVGEQEVNRAASNATIARGRSLIEEGLSDRAGLVFQLT